MKNKKLVIIIAAVVVVLAVVLAVVLLGGNKTPETPATPTEKEYKLGMGVVFGELKNGEINATLATVVLDDAGKIVSCRLDAVQNKFTVDFDEETVDFTRLETKMELGTAYGMATSQWSSDNDEDGRILEWYKQSAAFSSHIVGMTGAEVAGMPTKDAHGHAISADSSLVSAGCTIQITGIKAVVAESVTNAR